MFNFVRSNSRNIFLLIYTYHYRFLSINRIFCNACRNFNLIRVCHLNQRKLFALLIIFNIIISRTRHLILRRLKPGHRGEAHTLRQRNGLKFNRAVHLFHFAQSVFLAFPELLNRVLRIHILNLNRLLQIPGIANLLLKGFQRRQRFVPFVEGLVEQDCLLESGAVLDGLVRFDHLVRKRTRGTRTEDQVDVLLRGKPFGSAERRFICCFCLLEGRGLVSVGFCVLAVI